MQCGAKTKSGSPCRMSAMPNGRCRIHGGKTPAAGITHPTFKTGRYSKHLPTRLSQGYQQALSDPDLLQLNDEIRLTDSLISSLLERFDSQSTAHQRELSDLIEQRRRLVESEGKRLTAMQQMITMERALMLIGHITEAVLRHVDDPAARQAIARDIRAITG